MTTTSEPAKPVKLSGRNWAAIATLATTILGGLIDIKTDLATVKSDVAWLKQRADRDRAPAAIVRPMMPAAPGVPADVLAKK